MSIIKKKDIYEGGNPVKELTKNLEKLLVVEGKLTDQHKKLATQNEALSATLQQVKKSNDGTEAKKLITVTDRLAKSTVKLKEVKTASVRVNEQILKTNVKLVESATKEAITLEKVKIQKQQNIKASKDLARAELGLVKAHEKLTKQTNAAQLKFKNLAAQLGIGSKEAKKAQREFEKLDNRLRKINTGAKDGRRDVGRYGTALKGVGGQLLGAAGIVGGVDLLIKGFTNLAKRSAEITKLTRKVENVFETTTFAAKGLSATILALAKNFDEDYNEILKSANAVSKEFGISAEDSLKLIEEGFKKGSNNSGEFLDILREYPVQLKSVGLSAEESFAIINQQVRAGVYSDKGIDAIKEAGIQLRENNKAVQAALAPLAKQTRLEIERAAASGNTFKAMQLLSKAMDETVLTAAQTQTIMSNVFKGAGEDSLTFVQNLHEVELSLKGVEEQTTVVQNTNLALSKNWNRLIANISDDEGIFAGMWNEILGLLNFAVVALQKFVDLLGLAGDEGKKLGKNTEIPKSSRKSWDDLTEAEKRATKGIKDLTSEQKKQLEIARKINEETLKWADDYVAGLEAARRAEIALLAAEIDRREALGEPIEEIEAKGLDFDPVKASTDITKQIIDENAKLKEEAGEKELARLLELEEGKKLIKETFEAEASQFVSDLLSADQDNRLAETKSNIEAEKKIQEDNLEKGIINQTQFNAKIRDLNNKERQAEAKAEKKKALFDIAIATAINVAKAGFITPKAIAIAIAGAIQAVFIAAKPIPSFEKGGRVGGRLHRDGGTLIEAQKDEFVVNQQGFKNAPQLTEAINQGLIKDVDFKGGSSSFDFNILSNKLDSLNNTNNKMLQISKDSVAQTWAVGNLMYIRFGDGRIVKEVING